VIESGSELTGAVVHDNARISHGGRIDASVVGADAVLKPDVDLRAYSIVGARVSVPAGTRVAGGRLAATDG
jgi:UDP-3-O-[3-hydroxymyristoyl] glucosamine N-acyltransferase